MPQLVALLYFLVLRQGLVLKKETVKQINNNQLKLEDSWKNS